MLRWRVGFEESHDEPESCVIGLGLMRKSEASERKPAIDKLDPQFLHSLFTERGEETEIEKDENNNN